MFPISLSLEAKPWAGDAGTSSSCACPDLELEMGDIEEGMVRKASWQGRGAEGTGHGSRGSDAGDTAGAEGWSC